MNVSASKTIVIGLDAPITKRVKKYVEEGKMPNVARLIKEGVWAENCLVPHPTITPPNWTTIVTGSWPGTHGITCFHLPAPNEPLDKTYQAYSSADCQSEYIWQAAEKAGKKSIILNYPTTWPPTVKEGIQIGGAGLHVNDWRIDREGKCLPGWGWQCSIADHQLLAMEEYPLSEPIKFREAKEWKNLPPAKKTLEAEVKIGTRNTYDRVKPRTCYLLIQDTQGGGYDRVSLAAFRDGKTILFTLREGEWSKTVSIEFETDKGKKKAFFKGKLLRLSPEGKEFKLYLTTFCQADGWSFPESVALELEGLPGLPLRAMEDALTLGWIDEKTSWEMFEMENEWLGEAAYHLLKNYEWDLFFMHAHCPDHSYHVMINKIDPQICKDPKTVETFTQIEREFYISLDRMIGRILEATDEETLVIVVSDHGAVPTEGYYDKDFKGFNVFNLLARAGLAVNRVNPQTGREELDVSRSKAIPQRSVYIYVNLKGKYPGGIVEPEDYERVREQIINCLYDYTDPKTGKKPIVFALKKEDARILGLYGDRIGDVVYGIRPEFSGEHGRQIATGEYGIGSMKGLLIMAGPNIKKGCILKRTVWLTDIVPTICYLLKLPVPRDTEGAIIYQALEEPNFQIAELETLRKNYQRLKRTIEVQSSLTHSYEGGG